MGEITDPVPGQPKGKNFADLLSELTLAHAPAKEEWDKIKIELNELEVGKTYDWTDNTGETVPIKKVDETSYVVLWPEGYWD